MAGVFSNRHLQETTLNMISQALFIQHSRAKTLLSGLPAAGGSCMVVQAKSDPPPTHQSPLAGGPGGGGGAERVSGKPRARQHELLP